jgi:hypothetical protein
MDQSTGEDDIGRTSSPETKEEKKEIANSLS